MAKPIEIITEIRDEELKRYISQVEQRGKDLRPALKRCAIIMYKSFGKNFQQEGRPRKWKPLSPNTIAGRRKGSRRILQDTGRLRMSSISKTGAGNIYKLRKDSLKMGSSLQIAPYHQYGTSPHTIKAKHAKALRIPMADGVIFRRSVQHPGLDARVFITIQDEDVEEMKEVFSSYIVGEK